MMELITNLEALLHLTHGGLIGLTIGILWTLFVMSHVLIFGYYFYIDHGYILVDGENRGNKEKIKATLDKLREKSSPFAVGYPYAMLVSILTTGAITLIGTFWYVCLPFILAVGVIFAPAYIIKMAAKEKRNKVVFDTKLNGTFPDE